MEILLHVGDRSFFLEMDEAMKIAEVLCAAQFLGTEYRNSRNCVTRKQPDPQTATISPVTGYLQLEIEQGVKK
jgi:hypothetical protein